MENIKVLDACCGSKKFWFDKNDGRALYIDCREGTYVVDRGTVGTKGRSPIHVKPDMIADFRKMPFDDQSFWHVVFDPPHLTRKWAGSGAIGFSYGSLNKQTWKNDIAQGFAECFRVLKKNGTLIFKWCETEIPLPNVLSLTNEKPLYGHRTGKKAQTHWVSFIKG